MREWWILKTVHTMWTKLGNRLQPSLLCPVTNEYYNIARALVLSKSYWAIMNKIFMYARPCSMQWRVQFHFSCKISVDFMCKFLCLSFGNVKIILNNPNLTSSLWLFPGKDVYFNVSILTSFVFIFIEYLYCVWRVFGCVFILILSLIRRSEFHWRWF